MIIFISVDSDEQNLNSRMLWPVESIILSNRICNTNLALELLGHIASSSGNFLNISMALTDEDEQVVLNLTTEDLLRAFVIELDDQRQRFGFDELDNSFGCDFTIQSNLGSVEVLQE